jgi:hypothetical protein
MITTWDPMKLFLIIGGAVAAGSFIGLTVFAFLWGATLRNWLA